MKFFLLGLNLLLFYSIKINGQNYRAIYKVKYTASGYMNLDSLDDMQKNAYRSMKNDEKKAIEFLKNTEIFLDFNNTTSLFYIPKKLEIRSGLKNTIIRITGIKGKYFSTKNKTIQQKNSFGENFLVDIPKIAWKITNETKKIGNYICYKAYTTKEIKNPKGVFKIKIEAWYAPELPFNFGPREFNGLPDLIIHLKYGRKLFHLLKINKQKNINIKEPIDGKKITLKEFEKISENMYKSLRLNR